MSRKVIFTAVATMTPVFLAEAPAKAYSLAPDAAVSVQADAAAMASGKQILKQGLLALSPTEKLRLAGDRIRLAKGGGSSGSGGGSSAGGGGSSAHGGTQGKIQSSPGVSAKQGAVRRMGTISERCSGMLFV
jgi:hypothetical protein